VTCYVWRVACDVSRSSFAYPTPPPYIPQVDNGRKLVQLRASAYEVHPPLLHVLLVVYGFKFMT
jgi:hypothetical protein